MSKESLSRPQQLFAESGSIQKCLSDKWKTVGIGEVLLLHNPHHPTKVLLKVIKKSNQSEHMFLCEPKATESRKSLVLRGIHTKKNKEQILAVRFTDQKNIREFQVQLQRIRKSMGSVNAPTIPDIPKEKQKELEQYVWDCDICAYRNEPNGYSCAVCNSPRPLNQQPSETMKMSKVKPISLNTTKSINIKSLPAISTPTPDDMNHMKRGTSDGLALEQIMDHIDESNTQDPTDVEHKDEDDSGQNALDILLSAQSTEIFCAANEDDNDDTKEEKDKKRRKKQKADKNKSSLKELIVQVTTKNDDELMQILLLCHVTFATSINLLSLLLERCQAKKLDFTQRALTVTMVKRWMNQYWQQDFKYDSEVFTGMAKFCEEYDDPQNDAYHDLQEKEKRLMRQISQEFYKQKGKRTTQQKKELKGMKSTKLLGMMGGIDLPANYNIMDNTEKTISEQVTLMDFAIFKEIKRREMLGQGWKKKNRNERSPNLMDMINNFNQLSKWIQIIILKQPNKAKRSRAIRQFIAMAVCFQTLRNYSACCAVNFGLSATPVYRLKDAWAGVPPKEVNQYRDIQTTFKGSNNWNLLRKIHRNAYAPSILHTGLFLQDLLNTDEGNEDALKDGTVNLAKLKRLYRLMEQICMYQQSKYEIKEDPKLQAALKKDFEWQEQVSTDQMFHISTIVKQRDTDGQSIDPSELKWLS